MTFLRRLSTALGRKSDRLHAQDIVEAGAAGRREADASTATMRSHGTQGIRPYGFGY